MSFPIDGLGQTVEFHAEVSTESSTPVHAKIAKFAGRPRGRAAHEIWPARWCSTSLRFSSFTGVRGQWTLEVRRGMFAARRHRGGSKISGLKAKVAWHEHSKCVQQGTDFSFDEIRPDLELSTSWPVGGNAGYKPACKHAAPSSTAGTSRVQEDWFRVGRIGKDSDDILKLSTAMERQDVLGTQGRGHGVSSHLQKLALYAPKTRSQWIQPEQ